MKKSLIAIAVGAVIAPMANANIIISEITEGSGSNKAIEIANVGSSSANLDGYTVDLAPNGGDWNSSQSLDGVTLASGQTYVIVNASADAELKGKGDVESTVTYFNGNDAVAVRNNGSVVDIVGAGDGSKFNENVTLRRTTMSPSTTYDADKFEVVDMNDWSDFGKVELGGGAGEVVITEYVEGSSNNKAIELYNNGSEDIDLTGYKLVRYKDGDETPLDMVILDGQTLPAKSVLVVLHDSATITLDDGVSSITGGLYHNGGDAVGLFNGDSLVDVVGAVPTASGWGKDVTLQRNGTSPSATYNESDWTELAKDTFDGLGKVNGSVDPDPDPSPDTLISELQGDSWASPYTDPANGKFISDETFTVEGVITAIQSEALDGDVAVGFYMQDETPDSDPKTSDGIFVVGDITGLSVGDKVQVNGPVEEKFGWTQIPATTIKAVGTGSVTAVNLEQVASDSEFDFTLERHEGMLVNITSAVDMRVSRSYSMDEGPQRYNLVLSQGKESVHPNQANFPGTDEAAKAADCNDDARLVVESFAKDTVGAPAWYPDFAKTDIDQNGSTEDFIRVGDRASNLQGVLGYSYSDYRFYVTEDANNDTFIARGNNRDLAPKVGAGDVRIATFNVQEFFNSLQGGGESNDFLAFDATPGAQDSTQFDHQTAKLVAALTALDADIVGLMEIENNGFEESSAISYLVTQLNADLPEAKQYNIASSEGLTTVGELATANFVIFRPSTVGLDSLQVIPMPKQEAENGEFTTQHAAVVPVFSFKDREEKLVVAVNRFADKDQICLEDTSDDDRQGGCENLRVSAADYLGQKLAKMEGEKVILGSLNAFNNEDAITVLTDRSGAPENYEIKTAEKTFIGEESLHEEGVIVADSYGFENVMQIVDPNSYNVVQGDENGSLDYILTSAGLKSKVIGATHWNINASESQTLDSRHELGQAYSDSFRAAGHDPVVLSIAFAGKPIDPVDPVFPDPDQPVQPGTPVELPDEPINEPRPQAPIGGGTFNHFVDLTQYSDSAYLKVGDEVSVSFNNATQAFVATSSNVQKDVLDQFEIALGWTEVPISGLEVGDYTVTTAVEGKVIETKQVSITQMSDSGSDGGSFGLGGLLSLLGLGFLRRRFNK
ncbi:ExeM/NucH family extracellular endonuclease [Vibrio splendidus]|uniref:ExeM/NucH family extracellular endonuclease n=1 Tax=Vibrio splendidus TaxID=29497 RepID=UPI002468E5F0|nr:ExeM/NucH family extracellular endonuclease [Vibrio splendidus]MDH5889922.1 ExeM/NucH family extracellular endonuclease [Vibrio splendidus]